MKTVLSLILVCFLLTPGYAQAPDGFLYQAVVRSSSGAPMSAQNVTFLISILPGSITDAAAYKEVHTTTTAANGLVTLTVGQGTRVSGNFQNIQWGANSHFLRVEIDETGHTNFKLLGTTQLLSVPYALYAKNVENKDDADADPSNEIQKLSLNDHILSLSGTENIVDLTEYADNTDAQTLTISGNQLSISGGNAVTLPSGTIIPSPSAPVPVAYRGGQLFVHPSDNSPDIIFGEFIITGATSNSDGGFNTSLIVIAGGTESKTAARICDELVAFGFSDWYLPSRFELDAIYKQSYLIQDYEALDYWSSTETAVNKAIIYNMGTGEASSTTKNQAARCRCVRKN